MLSKVTTWAMFCVLFWFVARSDLAFFISDGGLVGWDLGPPRAGGVTTDSPNSPFSCLLGRKDYARLNNESP